MGLEARLQCIWFGVHAVAATVSSVKSNAMKEN